MPQNWEHSHGAQIASVLHQFTNHFDHGIIGSGAPYSNMRNGWGSHPATDHLFSGGLFQIVHDGSGYSRTQKVAEIAKFESIANNVKVCWEGSERHKNCGVCEKCIRTRLNFIATDYLEPKCFDTELTLSHVENVPINNIVSLHNFQSIVEHSRKFGTDNNLFIQALIQRLDSIENNGSTIASNTINQQRKSSTLHEMHMQMNLIEPDSFDQRWLHSTSTLNERLKIQQQAIASFLGQCQPLTLLSEMPGNIGDHLIWFGTEEMLTISGLAFDRLPVHVFNQSLSQHRKGTLLIPGSGAFTYKWHEWLPNLVLSASKIFERVVIFPSEFESEVSIVHDMLSQENVFPFARDAESYGKIKGFGKAELALDLALWARDLVSEQSVNSEQTKKNLLLAMRTDAASLLADLGLKPANQNNDISLSAKNLTEFLDCIKGCSEVVTDRLHVAVAAVMLNKQVHYVDPFDNKISRYIRYNFQEEFCSQLHRHDLIWLLEQELATKIEGIE